MVTVVLAGAVGPPPASYVSLNCTWSLAQKLVGVWAERSAQSFGPLLSPVVTVFQRPPSPPAPLHTGTSPLTCRAMLLPVFTSEPKDANRGPVAPLIVPSVKSLSE